MCWNNKVAVLKQFHLPLFLKGEESLLKVFFFWCVLLNAPLLYYFFTSRIIIGDISGWKKEIPTYIEILKVMLGGIIPPLLSIASNWILFKNRKNTYIKWIYYPMQLMLGAFLIPAFFWLCMALVSLTRIIS